MAKQVSAAEVAKHNTEEDCWIIIENKAYDVTPFLNDHPGGKKVITRMAGKDATSQFNMLHNDKVLKKYGPKFYVGDVSGSISASGASAAEGKQFTLEDVARHNNEKDCWVIIENKVYDVTPFLNDHPGGKSVITRMAGKDATAQFNMLHNDKVIKKYGPKFYVGDVAGSGVSAVGASAVNGQITPNQTASAELRSFSLEEVAKHNSEGDCWIIIDKKVYDVTQFLSKHPGGKKPVVMIAGKDATAQFNMLHSASVLKKFGPQLQIGVIGAAGSGGKKPKSVAYKIEAFGDSPCPYGDPNWYQSWNSPFYNETHRSLRAAMRKFVEEEISPFVDEWDENKMMPRDLFRKAARANILPAVIGPPWPTEYIGSEVVGGVPADKFDAFHELIVVDELTACGSGGVIWGLLGGLTIGLPPVMHFGSEYLKKKVVRDVLQGDKVICLAITEPYAGSDVANLKTTAVKTADGKHYVVNGEKKWITNGVFADYFTVAVRTGGEGMGGVSLLLIERNFPGVTTRQMKCQGVWPSGTTYITFEDVKVPIENLIGKENKGFKCIMYNFNHERWSLCIQASRLARVAYEEAFKYAHKRKTFGKRLVDHPVIRWKLAQMARQIEATHAWLEQITYQLMTMSHAEASEKLGGPTALLKAQCTQVMEFCAREAAQIFGGLAYTRGSQGGKVERIYREVRAYAIPGGSEEIMLDLGARQAMKLYSKF